MTRLSAAILIGFLSVPAFGAPSASPEDFHLAGIEPVVRPVQFRALLHDLEMGPSEMEAGEMLLRDYGDGMQTVLENLRSKQANDRARLDAALRGEIRISADELRTLRIALRTAARSACETADDHVGRMVEWSTLLSSAEPTVQKEAIGRFHRSVYLTGKGRNALVDIAAIAADSDAAAPISDEKIAKALAEYTSSLAQRARDDAVFNRSHQFDDGIAAITKDSDKRRDLQFASSTRWRDRIAMHDQAVEVIATVLGASAAPAWRAVASAALFPSIYRRPEAYRAAKWVQSNVSESAAVHVASCIESSRQKLNKLREEAVSLLREGREAGADLEHDASSLVESATAARMKFLRNSGERSVIEQEMLDCVMRPLTDGQRAAVRRVLRTTS
jgi:hypothetical protein